MIQMYKVTSDIRIVDVERQTACSVFFKNGMMERKRSTYHNYFDTLDEALEFLIEKSRAQIVRYNMKLRSIEREKDILEKRIAHCQQIHSSQLKEAQEKGE